MKLATHALSRFRPILSSRGLRSKILFTLTLLPFQLNQSMAAEVDSLGPLFANEWSYDHAAHLLERAGFGDTPEVIARFAQMSPQAAVDLIVNYEQISDDLADFQPSGIWDEAMLPDVDLHMRFDDVMAKAAEVGEVYGEVIADEELKNSDGAKTVFGQTGNWEGEDMVDLILQQEAAGEVARVVPKNRSVPSNSLIL